MFTTNDALLASLAMIDTPTATATWRPIHHTEARSVLLDSLLAAGIHPTAETIETDLDGQFAYGRFTLPGTDDAAWRMEAAWINDHTKTRGYTLAAGERVGVCSNGCVFAETVLKTKRTSGVMGRLADMTAEFTAGLRAAYVSNEARRVAYGGQLLGADYARSLVVRLAEAGCYPSNKILPVLAEFENPSFDYTHAPSSVLGLQSAVTHIAKGFRSGTQHDRTLRLTGVLDSVAGV